MEIIFNFLKQNSPIEIFAVILSIGFGFLLGKIKRHFLRRDLSQGRNLGAVIIQHNVLHRNHKGANPTLLFRTVGEIGSALYAQNPVLMELLHEVIQRLTPTNPAITFEEKSMQSLRIAMKNLISSGLNIASFPLQNVLVVVTCEDSKIAPTCKVRVFLISLKDLLFFADLGNCRNVQVEAASNFPRIATLHQLAKLYLKLGEGNKSGTERDTVFSTLQLALRSDYTPVSSVHVRWGEKEKELLATMGIQA